MRTSAAVRVACGVRYRRTAGLDSLKPAAIWSPSARQLLGGPRRLLAGNPNSSPRLRRNPVSRPGSTKSSTRALGHAAQLLLGRWDDVRRCSSPGLPHIAHAPGFPRASRIQAEMCRKLRSRRRPPEHPFHLLIASMRRPGNADAAPRGRSSVGAHRKRKADPGLNRIPKKKKISRRLQSCVGPPPLRPFCMCLRLFRIFSPP